MEVFTKKESEIIQGFIRRAKRDGVPIDAIRHTFNALAQQEYTRCEGTNPETLIFDEAALERIAYHDSLTGCFNRTKLNAVREKYNSNDLLVIMVDVNNMKMINDLLGHKGGDAHLKAISQELLKYFELTFRLGGDEFLLLTDWCTTSQAKIILSKISYISYGIFEKNTETSLSKAMEFADQLMYKNKIINKAREDQAAAMKVYSDNDVRILHEIFIGGDSNEPK